MSKVLIRNATLDDVEAIMALAEKSWWPAYGELLPHDQITFMLEKIYSREALSRAISTCSQQFILLEDDGVGWGFAAYSQKERESDVYKLHKLYINPDTHGKGYGQQLVHEVVSRLKSNGLHVLDLNVYRHNKARAFYEKLGFKIIAEEKIPLGPYILDDYIMRLEF
ncbi:MAG: GNAT family N-acetyltransferase [Chryseolinea sp.]